MRNAIPRSRWSAESQARVYFRFRFRFRFRFVHARYDPQSRGAPHPSLLVGFGFD
jgi:hypothetical protein